MALEENRLSEALHTTNQEIDRFDEALDAIEGIGAKKVQRDG